MTVAALASSVAAGVLLLGAGPAAAALIEGTPDDDIIDGTPRSDLIRAAGGNDIVRGHAGHDQIAGEAGDDLLVGGRGGDNLDGGPGGDELRGGLGVDVLESDSDVPDALFGGGQDDLVQVFGDATVHGGYGDDFLVDGGIFSTVMLHGDGGNDRFVTASSAASRFFGGTGDDSFDVQRTTGGIWGGEGSDLILLEVGTNARAAGPLVGGPGADTIIADSGGPDVIRCGPGADTVRADFDDRVATDCETVTVPPAEASSRG